MVEVFGADTPVVRNVKVRGCFVNNEGVWLAYDDQEGLLLPLDDRDTCRRLLNSAPDLYGAAMMLLWRLIRQPLLLESIYYDPIAKKTIEGFRELLSTIRGDWIDFNRLVE